MQKPLKLYAVFHLNIAYSSIEEERRAELIRSCYWPLLELAGKHGLPFGIEATGYTLEEIERLDGSWIERLNGLLAKGICEFVGSGYAQLIGPIVPSEVNAWNQRLGISVYERLLGVRPSIALINEMAYSKGMLEHYRDSGYKAVIMEWNNPRKSHPEWKDEWRYLPQAAAGNDCVEMPLIWSDSIAFQKFQRLAHGDYGIDEYVEWLASLVAASQRYFPIYSNDAEVFGFRPGRYMTESALNGHEWERLESLFVRLKEEGFEMAPLSKVLEGMRENNGGNLLSIESPEQPIPVKKQEKYNINRWALTGRGDLEINTACFSIYNSMLSGGASEEDWKELCYLWSSDFRTHITEKRWREYKKRLGKALAKWQRPKERARAHKGQCAVLPQVKQNGRLVMEGNGVKCVLDQKKGLAIGGLWFKALGAAPIIGTLPLGYYEDISLGADFFSGHLILERPGVHKHTDLVSCEPVVSRNVDGSVAAGIARSERQLSFKKEYLIPENGESIVIRSSVRLMGRQLGSFHPLNITFMPDAFERESLFFAAHNGGSGIEVFSIAPRTRINHSQPVSLLISSRQSLGATKGVVIVGDRHRALCFRHNQEVSAVMPSIIFQPAADGRFFLRLQYSAQEMDETFVEDGADGLFDFEWSISPWNGAAQ